VLTETRRKALAELSEARIAASNERRKTLLDALTIMKIERERDLAALEADEALARAVRCMSSKTISRMYLSGK
jgi:hypothetical protein